MPRYKNPPVVEKKPVQEIRAEIRSYIRNERDTTLKKQMALKEAIKSEDNRRLEFIAWKLKQDTRSLPLNIIKFIGTLKKSVRETIRNKGGTPFSIIRDLFVYWDLDKTGQISATELLKCMHSLGVVIGLQDCLEVVQYYANSNTNDCEMLYNELLKDITFGEPSLIAYVSEKEEAAANEKELRFEEFKEIFKEKPPIVIKFLEAVREWMQKLLRDVGGTPDQHVRFLFKFYDYDYSSGLYAKELVIACKRSLKLKIDLAQAEEIVHFYDRKKLGQMQYEPFLADVCSHVKPILSFTELTPRGIAEAKKSLAKNPFIPKPFAAPPNKFLVKFKQDCRIALANTINKLGGSVGSWMRDAFVFWDPGFTRKLSTTEQIIGAAKRVGVTISEAEAVLLRKLYDKYNTEEMHYDFLIEEIMNEQANFIMDSVLVDPSITPTSRTPPLVNSCMQKLKNAVDAFVRKSKGLLNAKDMMHGTFLRFDTAKSGFIDAGAFKSATKELRANSVTDAELHSTLKWFDPNGTQLLDYSALTRQVYGDDITTEKLVLPRLKDHTKKFNAMADSLNASTYGSTITPDHSRSLSLSALTTKSMLNDFGVNPHTQEKNLAVVENPSVTLAREKMKRIKILTEKAKVEKKIIVIDEQKRKILDDFKERHAHGK